MKIKIEIQNELGESVSNIACETSQIQNELRVDGPYEKVVVDEVRRFAESLIKRLMMAPHKAQGPVSTQELRRAHFHIANTTHKECKQCGQNHERMWFNSMDIENLRYFFCDKCAKELVKESRD